MKDWIPLLQSLVWPIFIVALLFVFRRFALHLLETIRRRIEAGAEVAVGPTGFTLGTAPVLKSDEAPKESTTGVDRSYLSAVTYVVHAARFARIVPEGKDYEITVRVYSTSQEVQDRIERVEYHLHSSYFHRIRESTDKEKSFELVLFAWGQFNLKVQVYLTGETQPLVLWRFLNF